MSAPAQLNKWSSNGNGYSTKYTEAIAMTDGGKRFTSLTNWWLRCESCLAVHRLQHVFLHNPGCRRAHPTEFSEQEMRKRIRDNGGSHRTFTY